MGRRPKYKISPALFAAVRDGDLKAADAARKAGVSKQVFDGRYRTFRVEQVRQRSAKAIRSCAQWLAYCVQIGWSRCDMDDLERLWWRWHDENGNLLSARRTL